MFLDRLNRWTTNRLQRLRDQRRGKMTVSAGGLAIHKNGRDHELPWTAIETIVALRTTDYLAGDTIGLTIGAQGGLTAHATEHDAEWSALVAGISEHLAGSLPYARWALAIAAGKAVVPVYRRGEFPEP
ncbi:hypothetical protein [Nitrospirillum viridazoti]|uniref:Uncharacterized protein n=1 Tax=Nitrospirillum amazonense TaxID=28077 RepID=A0A560IXH1_9PROT|nr:hypothetical protein [Nitrospirillum amazonense]TWB63557.1 hypothetical protein FBZ92_10348 [Nitrospirillum amazonense]